MEDISCFESFRFCEALYGDSIGSRPHFLRGSISLERSIDNVGISCGEAFRLSEASTSSAFPPGKHFA
jgi:hypothetical protein